ncbi:hypothetical protein CCMA1212_001217 [Trichoderma ghanense]|uniref:Uncharacterized protein n=1 Tax=Trichoderma ghanense TaxID=65468 RepID=A0ABY2HHN2_9HYPO
MRVAKKKTVQPNPESPYIHVQQTTNHRLQGSTQALGKRFQTVFGTPQSPILLPEPLVEYPDGMEKRIKKHVDDALRELQTHLWDMEDDLHADKKSQKRDNKALSRQLKEGHEKVDKRLDGMMKNMEKQLQLVQGLGHSMAEVMEQTKVGRKRPASEAFGISDDGLWARPSAGHAASFKQLERRLGTYFGNTQTHLESAICEARSGTFKRLADLDERIGALEERMDEMARFMAKWDAASSANGGPSA